MDERVRAAREEAPMTLFDHLFALILLVGLPVWSAWNARNVARLARRIAVNPNARMNEYLWTIAMEWGLTLALLAWWQWAARPFAALGVLLPEGTGGWWTVLVCVAGISFYAQQARTVAASPDAQASLRKELESQPNVRMILPRTVREARVFTGVAITAGICEEVLYRGYLLWYLQSCGLGRGAVVVAIVAFGLAHAYQGIRGSVASGVMGAVFMGLYLLTGSLVAPIVLHATVDLANVLMAYRFFQRTETAATSIPDVRGGHDRPDVTGGDELRG
jgi:membrane protease YdiL (CAAX protease family)